MNLVALNNVKVWERIEKHCPEVTSSVPHLAQHEDALQELRSKTCFTKAELDKVVLWKHTCGKNRIYNIKYLNANTEDSIKTHSKAAIELAMNIDASNCLEEDGSLSVTGRSAMQEAITELGKLKGVGPATASAILSLVRPDCFCFLYDECIDTLEKTRDYKVSNYLRVNTRCMQLARDLGGDWTTSRVAKAIWTAARFLALNGRDLTRETAVHDDEETDCDDAEEEEKTSETNKQKGKRQRTK